MIAWLSGRVQTKAQDSLIVDVSGVGYQVYVPVTTIARLPETGEPITLHIHTHLREDSLSLFGFATDAEKEVFQLLLGVSGIGPKLALAILSNLSVDALLSAIQSGDEAALSRISGIGKKTAARLCLELKDKVKIMIAGAVGVSAGIGPVESGADDAVGALVNLGYKRPAVEDAVRKARQGRPDIRIEDVIREALSLLAKR
ncbi:MAG: Holliday junction branch migration protein RuvA [Nitrospiraceae bacterium]|nr:Holliday junction branch migration protein RuvA [Nitrospiraceae bacterium]